jgi:hypothetical protein
MKGSIPNCYVQTLKALYKGLAKKVTKRCMRIDESPVTSTGHRRTWSEGVTLMMEMTDADEAAIRRVMSDFVTYLDAMYPNTKHREDVSRVGDNMIVCRIGTVKGAIRIKPTTEGIDSFLLGKANHHHHHYPA